MKHYGDICELSGYDLEPVDVIVGGSPCQDISQAGTRKGIIEGERSNLFFEQLRIVKEMREKTNGEKPRYLIWENVPRIISASKGKEFFTVLTEIIKISENSITDVLLPDNWGGRWSKSGCVYSETGRWSIAWRLHNAQFWGAPQRRRRLSLVVDFRGLSAPEILYERKGLYWDPEAEQEKK